MGDQFDWHVGEDENDELPEEVIVASSRVIFPVLFVVGTAVLLIFLIGSWQIGQKQAAQSDNTLQSELQALLDFQHEAFLRGDGELFFASYLPDPAFQAAQLLPYNMAAYRAGMQATRVRQHNELVWVNVAWEAADETYQRILFFARQNNSLTQVASDKAFWGDLVVRELDWGTLQFYEVDKEWAANFETAVSQTIDTLCTDNCSTPLTISIVNHYRETAVANHIQIPSPRLIALDENGNPASLFWTMLEQRIADRLTPATIHFVVPRLDNTNIPTFVDYEQVAAQFTALHPNITIELTFLDTTSDDLTTLATQFDGAAIAPSQEMIAAGFVYDLTGYVNTDVDFDPADFYEQIWQGVLWQDRAWMVPQAAQMRLLFYDTRAYQTAELPTPSLRWTWNEMAQDVSQLGHPTNQDILRWGYLDTGLDSLYSYAYNWNNQCTQTATILCQTPLRTQNVAAALEWYRQMAVDEQSMPNLVEQLPELLGSASLTFLNEEMHPEQREHFLLSNFQSAKRMSVIWVDAPINYEHQLLLSQIGVVSFPGSDRFDGITPLRIQGNFISQASERPFAVWQWIKFLSYQRPSLRYVPARPSVANEIGFWRILPQPLGDVMRTAFPFAKPITIEEQTAITWEQVTAVVSGKLTPAQAANQRNSVIWFNNMH